MYIHILYIWVHHFPPPISSNLFLLIEYSPYIDSIFIVLCQRLYISPQPQSLQCINIIFEKKIHLRSDYCDTSTGYVQVENNQIWLL